MRPTLKWLTIKIIIIGKGRKRREEKKRGKREGKRSTQWIPAITAQYMIC